MFVWLRGGPQKDTNESMKDALQKHPLLWAQLWEPGLSQVPVDPGGWRWVGPKKCFKECLAKDLPADRCTKAAWSISNRT